MFLESDPPRTTSTNRRNSASASDHAAGEELPSFPLPPLLKT